MPKIIKPNNKLFHPLFHEYLKHNQMLGIVLNRMNNHPSYKTTNKPTNAKAFNNLFVWSETPEGWGYWSGINEKYFKSDCWKEILKSLWGD